jgi:signal transduction histidine kinase
VALEVPLAFSVRDRVNAEVRSQARAQADVVAATAPDLLVPARRAQLSALAATAGRSVRGRVIVVDRQGRLIADSAGPARLGDDYGGRPELRAALAGRTAQETRSSRTLSAEILATAVPVLRNGRPAGAVRVTQSVDAVQRATRRAILGLILIGVLVLVLGLATGALIAAQMARPVRQLDAVARRVGSGDLEARAPVTGTSEQRSLARAFNDMTVRVGRLLRGQQDFVADASHQLRTPLTGLRLRVEEADAATREPAVRRELEAALEELDRLAVMVEELLVLSRAGERERPGSAVELAAAARRAVERWAPTAGERGMELRRDTASGAGAVWCAEADLDRALDVLVENALLYAPSGTAVTVAVSPGAIEVLDHGPGLAPGEENEVFERFHRGRAGRTGSPGTGLGLAIAAELAGEWDGSVTLANRPTGGLRARLDLPVHVT